MLCIRTARAAAMLATGVAFIVCSPLAHARAGGFATIYSFQGGSDGEEPQAALIADKNGNLYGTTAGGGASCGNDYCGTVFEMTPGGSETVLHIFQGGNDGVTPRGGLLRDHAGNLYGTTSLGGGDGGCSDEEIKGCGTVFELAPDGTETVLYRFTGGSDGSGPEGTLIADKKGNLYGMTFAGGSAGDGVVFEVAPNGTETVLHSFAAGKDGASPSGGLIADKHGNLYGLTSIGGSADDGVLFKLTPSGKETVLYSFCSQANCADGGQPSGNLLFDKSGNLYGTASIGGSAKWGVVFKLAPDGTESVVYSFAGGSDGIQPVGGVIADTKGNLYGVTYLGGTSKDGTVFAISPSGSEQVLYEFPGGLDGLNPAQALLLRKNVLYGTTELGGANALGNVFKLKK
jgi:uncharacterized repeat protein (TIGR03803 family)